MPIGIGAALAAPFLLGESEKHPGELDVPGAVTATHRPARLVYGITRAGDSRTYGWGDPWTLAALAVGAVLLAVFVAARAARRAPAAAVPDPRQPDPGHGASP